MLLTEKTERLKTGKNGELTQEKEFLVSLEPNHYNIPILEAVFNTVKVGWDYDMVFTESEPK
jgi:hypothetical protein